MYSIKAVKMKMTHVKVNCFFQNLFILPIALQYYITIMPDIMFGTENTTNKMKTQFLQEFPVQRRGIHK